MHWLAQTITAVVAALHLLFLVLELFLWNSPYGRKTFGLTPEFAAQSRALAANQGLYNGFLVAGLVWGLLLGPVAGRPIVFFFLSCVVVAGVFGAATVSRRIFFVQALPAIIAGALLWLG